MPARPPPVNRERALLLRRAVRRHRVRVLEEPLRGDTVARPRARERGARERRGRGGRLSRRARRGARGRPQEGLLRRGALPGAGVGARRAGARPARGGRGRRRPGGGVPRHPRADLRRPRARAVPRVPALEGAGHRRARKAGAARRQRRCRCRRVAGRGDGGGVLRRDRARGRPALRRPRARRGYPDRRSRHRPAADHDRGRLRGRARARRAARQPRARGGRGRRRGAAPGAGGGARAVSALDPVSLAVIANRLDSIVREMENTLLRTGRSAVLNMARDFSCALITADNRLLASAEGLPVHVIGMEFLAEAVTELHPELREGDAFLHNDPYLGNTHPADHVILVPVLWEGQHVFTAAAKAHQADCGNAQPTTYMPYARDVYEEGSLIFPAVRVQQDYRDVDDVIRMCRRRIRVPDQWYGDYLAMLGAAR